MDPLILRTVYVGNAFGILTIAMLLLGNSWSLRASRSERRTLLQMLLITLVACIADPVAYSADGTPGIFSEILIYVSNSWLYVANICLGMCWIKLISEHLNIAISRFHSILLKIMFGIGIGAVVINFISPVIFSVENNVYARGPLYWMYLAIAGVFIVDGLFLYRQVKKSGGILKYFPVWLFVLPLLFGITIQTLFYGISAIWPCVAIGMACLIASIQKEMIVIDNLTGIYNRFYLDFLKDGLQASSQANAQAKITGMMIDLNDFKHINDLYGHATGDDALITTARILMNTIGTAGNVTRYAGDEFVILLNSVDHDEVESWVGKIQQAFADFNETSGKPYKLSAAIGYAILDLTTHTMSEFMNIIDKKMYENKRNYYSNTNGADRRKTREGNNGPERRGSGEQYTGPDRRGSRGDN